MIISLLLLALILAFIFWPIKSDCCGAKIVYTYGWDYRDDGYKCSECGKEV